MSRPAAAAAAALLALACAPVHPLHPAERVLPIPLAADAGHDEPALVGVVHVVRKGETVWRIARAYGIDTRDLMETNGIADPRTVATGAELFVPGAAEVVEVPPADAPHSASPRGPPAPSTAVASPSPPDGARDGPGPEPREPPRDPPPAPNPVRSASAAAPREEPAQLAWPLKGVLYGRFGVRAGERHDGIDIAAPEGSVVGAAADGTVIFAGEQAGYGEIVILRHDDGIVTLYAHNSALLVKDGARVRRGQPIARVGQTGRTTGPHLHFEVRQGARPRNPLLFLP